MKKLFVLSLALVLALSLTACGEDKKQPESADTLPSAMQPGAEMKNFVNEDGAEEHTYLNPDGTGGGGAEVIG